MGGGGIRGGIWLQCNYFVCAEKAKVQQRRRHRVQVNLITPLSPSSGTARRCVAPPALQLDKVYLGPSVLRILPAPTLAPCRTSVKVTNAVTVESINHLFVFHLVDHISMVGRPTIESNVLRDLR